MCDSSMRWSLLPAAVRPKPGSEVETFEHSHNIVHSPKSNHNTFTKIRSSYEHTWGPPKVRDFNLRWSHKARMEGDEEAEDSVGIGERPRKNTMVSSG